MSDSHCLSSISRTNGHGRGPRRRWLLLALLALTVWGLVDVRRRGYPYPEAPQQHKTDLTVYTEAGGAFFDGRPPYAVCNPRGWTYVYPPILALMVAPLHAFRMQDQSTIWFFLCLAMCWGTYRECARIMAVVRKPDDHQAIGRTRWVTWLGVIAVATATLPTLNCLQRGQVSIVILYSLLLGLRLILTGRTYPAWVLGGIVMALPVAIKVVPLVPIMSLLFVQLAGFVWRRRRDPALAAQPGRQLAGSTLGVGLGLVLFFLLVPATLIGWNANLRHLDTWAHLVLRSAADGAASPGFEKDTHSARNQCLGNAVYRLGNFGAYLFAGGPDEPLVDDDNAPPRLMDAASVNTCLLFVRITLLAALLLVGLRLSWSSCRLGADISVCPNAAGRQGRQERLPHLTALSQAAGFGLACAVLLVVSPVARNHYFLLLAPAVLFVPLWLDRLGRRRAATVLAVVPGVLVVLQYVLLPYVGQMGLLGLGMTGWVLAAMLLVDGTSRGGPDLATGRDTADAYPVTTLAEAA